jgi:hypothetical protein
MNYGNKEQVLGDDEMTDIDGIDQKRHLVMKMLLYWVLLL